MSVNYEERIRPGIIFLNTLGLQLDVNKEYSKWINIGKIYKDEKEVGYAYFSTNYINFHGEYDGFKFNANYKLNNHGEDDVINCHLFKDNYKFLKGNYEYNLVFTICYPLKGLCYASTKLQVISDSQKKIELIIPNQNKLILERIDRTKHQHIRDYYTLSQDDEKIEFDHLTENINENCQTKATITIENKKMQTILVKEYKNGKDYSIRNHDVTTKNIFHDMWLYIKGIDVGYDVHFLELDYLTNGLFSRLVAVCMPELNDLDYFGLTHFLTGEQSKVIFQNNMDNIKKFLDSKEGLTLTLKK